MRGLSIALFIFTVFISALGIVAGFSGTLRPVSVLIAVASLECLSGLAATLLALSYLSRRPRRAQGNVTGLDYLGALMAIVIGLGSAVLTLAGQFASVLGMGAR